MVTRVVDGGRQFRRNVDAKSWVIALATHLCLVSAYCQVIAQDVGTKSAERISGQTQFSWPKNPALETTVVFLGDSITHQSLYTQYLEDFFWTRYPDRNVRFLNAGVAGDSVADALARFDWDVAAHQPDYVTVLFGMNDGRYEGLHEGNFVAYQENMKRLLERIEAIGAEPIVLSPTMFDHAVTRWRADDAEWRFRGKTFSPDYNAVMALFGAWTRELSRERGNAFVDLWAPLNTLTDEVRRQTPEFTLIGDAIHPQASGQLVIAYEILTQLGVERRVADTIALTKRGKRWVGGKGIQNLVASEDGKQITFAHQANSLPWVIPEQHSNQALRWKLPSDGRRGYELTHAGHQLSADRFKVAGLQPGQYEVRVDGALIGTWNHLMLGFKVELQENDKTPQYQQALQVANLNRQRTDDYVRPIRDRAATIKRLLSKHEKNPGRFVAETQTARSSMAELQRKAAEVEAEIHRLAQPQLRVWEIRRVN